MFYFFNYPTFSLNIRNNFFNKILYQFININFPYSIRNKKEFDTKFLTKYVIILTRNEGLL